MAFNDFLDRVKDTSSVAMDKAKDTTKRMATVNDLKSQIRAIKNEKNNRFSQMGMDVYLSRKEGKEIEDSINDFVQFIDESNEKIRDLQMKITLIETDDL